MRLSLEQKRDKVVAALRKKANDGLYSSSFYAVATYDDRIVVSKDGQLWSVPFTIDAKGNVTLAAEQKAEIDYPVVQESSPYAVTEQRQFDGLLVGPLANQEGEPDGSRWHAVIIEAGVSMNRRNYRESVLDAAKSKYEGVSVFYNHVPPGSQRDVRELIGDITGVSGALLEAKDARRYALTGVFTVFDKPLQTKLLEAHRLGKVHKFGFSHDVSAPSRIITLPPHGVVQDVTEIKSVTSVDLVAHAAAGGRVARIAEALASEGDIRMFEHLLEWLKTNRPDLFKKLSAEPTQEQVEALVQEALRATPAPSDGAPTPPATPPASPAQPGAATRVQESVPTPDSNAAFLRELLIDRALQGRTVPATMATRLREDLERRPTLTLREAQEHIDGWITAIAPMRDRVVGSGLGTVVETTLDEAEKRLKALDGFFQLKPIDNVPAYRSFREAYVDITGDKNVTGNVREAVNLRTYQRLYESPGHVQEALSTASWGEILGDSIRRAMLADYRATTNWDDWRRVVSTISSITDFRTNRRMRLGGFGDLPTVAEDGPYPALASPTDEEVTYAISKKGGTERINIEMIANDDVGAIRRIPMKLSRAAKRTLYRAVFATMKTNANIYTGTALALGGQNNISTVALSSAEIAAARVKMAKQTAYATADEPLNLYPKHLIVPPDLEELGWRLTSIPMADTAGRVATEPSYVRQRVGLESLIVNPDWTDANNWWLVADTADIPTIEVGFWNGQEEPDIFIADNPTVGSMFTNDQILYKIRFVFGVVYLDFRGFFGGIVP